jgi:GNAT superfamily N-acetyltransferase
LNLRPLGYEPSELPSCSTPRWVSPTLPNAEHWVQIAAATARYRAGVQIKPVEWDNPAAAALRAAQRVEIAQRYGRPDSEPGTPPTADDIAYFVVAIDADGTPAACGGLRRLGDETGEVKRMYVVPQCRGTGVATKVLEALEDHARELGWTHLRLETGDAQPDAVAFYTRQGYRPIPRFGAYADTPSSLCFERPLA